TCSPRRHTGSDRRPTRPWSPGSSACRCGTSSSRDRSPRSRRRCARHQPARSDHQKASDPSFVTYQLTGSKVGGPISTKVLLESRAMTCTAPLFASTDARYALLEPRVIHVTYTLSDAGLHAES